MGNHSMVIIGLLVVLSYVLAAPPVEHTESAQKQANSDLEKDEQMKVGKLASDNQEAVKVTGEKSNIKESQKNNEGNEAINKESQLVKDTDSPEGDELSSADFDAGFESILKDVLITLRDNPGIIKDIIEGEEKDEQYSGLPSLMDFQNPPPQLKLSPKRVEKKAGSKQFTHRILDTNMIKDNSDDVSMGEYYKNKYARSSESSEDDDSSENYYKLKYGHSSSESSDDQSDLKSRDDSSSHESHGKDKSGESEESRDSESSHRKSSSSEESLDSDDSDDRIRNVKRVPEQPEETIDLTTFAVQRRNMYNKKRGNWGHPPHSMKMNLRQRSYNYDTKEHPDPRDMLHHSLFKNSYMSLPSMRAPKMPTRMYGVGHLTGENRNSETHLKTRKFARGQLENNLKAIKQQKPGQVPRKVKLARLAGQSRVKEGKVKNM